MDINDVSKDEILNSSLCILEWHRIGVAVHYPATFEILLRRDCRLHQTTRLVDARRGYQALQFDRVIRCRWLHPRSRLPRLQRRLLGGVSYMRFVGAAERRHARFWFES